MNTEITYFASGSNHAGEIRGLAMTGNHVGVCACDVNEEAVDELTTYAPGPMQVFVDSGAFGEVGFPGGVPTIVHPISDAEWNKRLGLYERLATRLRRQLWVVAPDCVAHQELTLERLQTHAARVRAMAVTHRVNVIVPVQKGALSMAEFAARAEAILQLPAGQLVWGIPMKKDATTVAELAEFAAALHARGGHARIHLLGLGPKSRGYQAATNAVLFHAPTTSLSCDSVRITALVGRTNGVGNGPRPLTAARDRVLAESTHETQGPHSPVHGLQKTAAIKFCALSLVFGAELGAERHAQDEDCTVEGGECTVCHVTHGDPCTCGGRGFHRVGCPESDAPAVPVAQLAALAAEGCAA